MLRRWSSSLVWGVLRLVEATGAQIAVTSSNEGRFAGVRLQWRAKEPDAIQGTIRSFGAWHQRFRFFIADDSDSIQRCHRRGRLYEEEELEIIARHFSGGTFVDVGANVGNHSIFAATVLGAERVIAFEPEPHAADICEINIALNGVQDLIVLHRIGLSDHAARAVPVLEEHNLGGTRLDIADEGPIRLVPGDEVLSEEAVSFVKIDTEGHELSVLAGLAATIERCGPTLFVEVANANIDAFKAFCRSIGYDVAECFRRYDVCANFVALPLRQRPAGRKRRQAPDRPDPGR